MDHHCGLDVSDKSTAICVLSIDGGKVFEAVVSTEKKAIQKALKRFGDLRCVVEASPLAEMICDWVEATGARIDILDPRRASAVIKSKKKTDPIDALKLAQLCRVGWYTKVHRKSAKAREIRTYLTARMQIVRSATKLYNTIRGLLRAHGIRIGEGRAKFQERVRKVLEEASPVLQNAISPLLDSWLELRKQEKQMYRAIRKTIVESDPVAQELCREPGVGPQTAAAFIATVDDPTRFSTAEKLSSYLGLTPSIYQSGEVEIRGRITKQGDPMLRWMLIEAATVILTISKKDTALKRWGLALKERKGFGKATVAVARKLACRLHYQWMAILEPRECLTSV